MVEGSVGVREEWKLGEIRKAVELFNAGKFFECHEVLEAVWLKETGEEKRLLQGLIQIAAAFHHCYRRRNYASTISLIQRGGEKLGSRSRYYGIDLDELRAAIGAILRGGVAGLETGPPPPPQLKVIASTKTSYE